LKWITDCIKVGKLLDTQFYLVFEFDKFINSDTLEDEKELSNKIKSKRKPKLISNNSPKKIIENIFLKKDNKKQFDNNDFKSVLEDFEKSPQNSQNNFKIESIFERKDGNQIENKLKKIKSKVNFNEEYIDDEFGNEQNQKLRDEIIKKKENEKDLIEVKISQANLNKRNKSKPKEKIESKKPLSFFKTDEEINENKEKEQKNEQAKTKEKIIFNKEKISIPDFSNKNEISVKDNIEDGRNESIQRGDSTIDKTSLDIFKSQKIHNYEKKGNLKSEVKDKNQEDSNNSKFHLKKSQYKDNNEKHDEFNLASEHKLNNSYYIKNNKNFQTDKKKQKIDKNIEVSDSIKINEFNPTGKPIDIEKKEKENSAKNKNNLEKSKAQEKENYVKKNKKENFVKVKQKMNKKINIMNEQDSFDEIELSLTEDAKNAYETNKNSKNIYYDFTNTTTENNLTDFGLSSKISDLEIPDANKIYKNNDNKNSFNLNAINKEQKIPQNYYNSKNSKNYKNSKSKADKNNYAFNNGNRKNEESKKNKNNNENSINKTILESDNEHDDVENTKISNNIQYKSLKENKDKKMKEKLKQLIINPNDHFSLSYTDSESSNDILKILNKKKIFENLTENFSQSPKEELNSDDSSNKSNKTINLKNKNNRKGKASSEKEKIQQQTNKKITKQKNQSKNDSNKSINEIITTKSQGNLNTHITEQLEKMLEYHIEENDTFETLAYRRAISQLKNAKEKIINESQLGKYKYLGKSIKQKIKEIITTGKLKKLDYLKKDEKNIAINKLKTVHGIGLQLANKLYLKGIKTIEDLRQNQELLNPTQKIGLQYYEDLIKRIPRKECEDIFEVIKEKASEIIPRKLLQIEICGSYRRGKETIGDLDILLTVKDNRNINGILSNLIEKLFEENLIKEILSLSKEEIDIKKHSFMGICKLYGNPHRRIDIKVYYKESFPFALLYFTGSAYFNRSLRLYAKNNNFSLSDYGLVKHDPNRPNDAGINIKCENEEDIFAALGLEYKPPSERDI